MSAILLLLHSWTVAQCLVFFFALPVVCLIADIIIIQPCMKLSLSLSLSWQWALVLSLGLSIRQERWRWRHNAPRPLHGSRQVPKLTSCTSGWSCGESYFPRVKFAGQDEPTLEECKSYSWLWCWIQLLFICLSRHVCMFGWMLICHWLRGEFNQDRECFVPW